MAHTVTLIPGDGVGLEVTQAAQEIINACGVKINWEECEAGAAVFKKGIATGVPEETIASIRRNKIALKGPLETPVGFGNKSANVFLRKTFDTFGNIRPIKEIPGVATPYSDRNIDLVIVRENLEDLYGGIEHMQSPNLAQCIKLISRPGCENIVRLAFEVARAEGRKTIHCATKSNIMKLSEGMLKRIFEEIAPQYPEIQAHHILVDNCAYQLVKKPEQFEVIVTTNMNGDILSDLASALIGGLGFAPGANIGYDFNIFEAVHGSAPKYAGKNLINPSAVIMSAILMLHHLKESDAAIAIENALHITLAIDKVCPQDVKGGNASTQTFTKQIIKNLGKTYQDHKEKPYKPFILSKTIKKFTPAPAQQLIGLDLFVITTEELSSFGNNLSKLLQITDFELNLISDRGIKVYPLENQKPLFPGSDVVRCRLFSKNGKTNDQELIKLLQTVSAHYKWVHLEKLQTFDGVEAFSKAHGENSV